MQTVIVMLIIIAAAIYVGRVFYRGITQQNTCESGCGGCGLADECGPPPDDTGLKAEPRHLDP
jgi:hypothetical protein